MAKNDGPRSTGEMTVTIGLLSTKGKLYTIENREEAKEAKTFYVAPCEHLSRVEQYYVATDGCVPDGAPGWKTGEMLRGKEIDGTVVVATNEEVNEARRDDEVEKKKIDLNISPSSEFESQTWPSGTTYWFEPDSADTGYAALVKATQKPEVAVWGLMVLRSSPRLYRARPGQAGGVVLQECLRPQETYVYSQPEISLDDKNSLMLDLLLETLSESFDPTKVRSNVADRMRRLMAEKAGNPITEPVPAKKKVETSIESQLAAALAAAQAAKVKVS